MNWNQRKRGEKTFDIEGNWYQKFVWGNWIRENEKLLKKGKKKKKNGGKEKKNGVLDRKMNEKGKKGFAKHKKKKKIVWLLLERAITICNCKCKVVSNNKK